jgi:uroporphyrinogen decarboxylase
MVFDTAEGELSPQLFSSEVVPQLRRLTAENGSRIGYYSKGTQPAYLHDQLFTGGGLAGIGVDQSWDIREAFDLTSTGFVQGNFDQALLHAGADDLARHLRNYLEPLTGREWPGWICGLGHGVLPGTPEENVRVFVDMVRETFDG